MTTYPFWDAMYAGDAYRYGMQPNAFLAAEVHRIAPGGAVLCVGDGEGRNGVWLAEQGFAVTSLDASQVAQQKTEALAQARGVQLTTRRAMLPKDGLPTAAYDAVVLIYLHLPPDVRPQVHAQVVEALKPGGLILLEGFTTDQLQYTSGGPKNEAMLFTRDRLRADFAALTLDHLDALETDLDEGPGHQGRASVIRLIGRK